MKAGSVLQVLMYLFRHHIQTESSFDTDSHGLIEELETVGFIRPVINQAIGWLTNLIAQNTVALTPPSSHSFRVFSEYERELFSTECQNFIVSLEKQGILNPSTRELVIQQAMDLQSEGIDISLIKWVALMVLFNKPEESEALTCMELLVLDTPMGGIH